MDQCPAAFQPLVQHDLNAAWAAIGVVTVDDKERSKNWQDWRRYAMSACADPYLRGIRRPGQQNLLIAFAARVQTGLYGKGRQVGHQSVEKSLHQVAQTLQLAGYNDPQRTYGSKELNLPFRHLLKGYKEQDPAPKLQLALPVATIEHAGAYHQAPQTALTKATADLITIGFFFLLQVGEYTMPRRHVWPQTEQFCLQDGTFQLN